jgi:hypothetical protein
MVYFIYNAFLKRILVKIKMVTLILTFVIYDANCRAKLYNIF